jgi:hypothetical protein
MLISYHITWHHNPKLGFLEIVLLRSMEIHFSIPEGCRYADTNSYADESLLLPTFFGYSREMYINTTFMLRIAMCFLTKAHKIQFP